MIDFVIPNNNEDEFIVMTDKLGYKGLYFLYDLNDYLNKNKTISTNNKKIKIYTGILADKKNIYKIKTKFKNKDIFVAVKSSNNDREVIEKAKINMIFSLEENFRRDFIHQRASGLNHILCKSAKENDVTIGFSVKSILDSQNKREIMGRITQNINLCRKFKVKTTIASFAQNPFEMKNTKDLTSLFEILGNK